uniref:Rhodnius prolixus MIP like protein n=1 Tax=Rhodnius prolixus TaxID=13249 RepID=Q9GRH9_RHOPR|nr:rhodnius prolixus MIP like protein [Rhodnius prolixus]
MPAATRNRRMSSICKTRIGETKDMSNVEIESSLKIEDNHLSHRPSLAVQTFSWRKCIEIFIAEVVATSLLLCLGCMSTVVGFDGSQSVHKLQPALAFGFLVSSLITSFGHISGAHMNPVVTICFYMMGTIEAFLIPIYLAAEIIGSVLGMGLLLLVTPVGIIGSRDVCTTIPNPTLNSFQALGVEFVCTSLLLLVLLGCSDVRNADKQDSVPLKFAGVIITLSLLGGPYTGASVNPVRSFAPALWSHNWTANWVYWVGPSLSGFDNTFFLPMLFSTRKKMKTCIIK